MCCSVVFCVFQLIQVLSAYSADLGAMDMEDCTPLHYAAATGSASCCKFLAQRGAVRKSKNISNNFHLFGVSKVAVRSLPQMHLGICATELRQALLFISFCCYKLRTLENTVKNLTKKEQKPREHAAARHSPK